jgi:phospholipase/carboxylesterase
MILLHGRGSSALHILEITDRLQVGKFALLAPQAPENSWYPHSFMAPLENNEPAFSDGIAMLRTLVEKIQNTGIGRQDIFFLGFSQGGCLLAEFLVNHADLYGGAFLFSSGLMGKRIDWKRYHGSFKHMPVLIGCSNIDAHIPLHRVQDSSQVFTEMGAQVTERIYLDGPHSIIQDEIDLANEILIRPSGRDAG